MMKNVELTSGWHEEELGGPVPFHWMERQAAAVLHIAPRLHKGETAFLSVSAVDPGGQLGRPTLTVTAEGTVLGQSAVHPEGWEEYAFPLPVPGSGDSGQVSLTLHVNRWLGPREGDPRELGLAVRHIRLLRAIDDCLPDIIELESTTSCNINPPCVMCYPKSNTALSPPVRPRDLDDRLLDAVRPAMAEATTLSLHGIGEPLCSSKTRRLLGELGDKPNFVQFNTNGLLLTESWAKLLVERKLHRLCFSIDAARPETYRKIRHDDLGKVVDNIKRLQRIKEQAGSPKPLVEMNMTLMRLNLGEAEEFVRLAAGLGARYVVFGLLNKTADYSTCIDGFTFRYTEQMIDEEDPKFIACMERCRALAGELNVELTINTSEVPL